METNHTPGIATLAELRNQWHQLRDIDRALAVHKLHKAGTSLRALAKALGRSESLLRNLNLAAQAPMPDRILARQGRISTRKLVGRAKQAQALRASTEREAQERKGKEDAEKTCQAICDWLDRKQWSPAFAEPLVEEARRYLAFAEARQLVPSRPCPPLAWSLDQVLERLWPSDTGDVIQDINLCAESLVKFVIAALPDSTSRHRALQLALDKQIRKDMLPR